MSTSKKKCVLFCILIICITCLLTSCARTSASPTPNRDIPYEELDWCNHSYIPAFEYNKTVFYSIGAPPTTELPSGYEPCGILYIDNIEEQYEIVYVNAETPEVVYVSNVGNTQFEPFTTELGTMDLVFWDGALYVANAGSVALPDGYVEAGQLAELVYGIPVEHGQTNDFFSQDGIVYTCTENNDSIYVEGKRLKLFEKRTEDEQ